MTVDAAAGGGGDDGDGVDHFLRRPLAAHPIRFCIPPSCANKMNFISSILNVEIRFAKLTLIFNGK